MSRLLSVLILFLLSFSIQADSFMVKEFSELPILEGGRIKPLDSVARQTLLLLKEKQKITLEGQRVTPIEWFLALSTRPEVVDKELLFKIVHPDLLALFGTSLQEGKYYSFEFLRSSLATLETQSKKAKEVDSRQRNPYQRAVISLFDRVMRYVQVKNSFFWEGNPALPKEVPAFVRLLQTAQSEAHKADITRKAVTESESIVHLTGLVKQFQFSHSLAIFNAIPSQTPSGWRTIGESLIESMVSQEIHPVLLGYAQALDHYREGDVAGFNLAVTKLRDVFFLSHPSERKRAKFEALFNRVAPFYKAMVLYVFVFLIVGLSWLKWSALTRYATYLLYVAFASHTLGLLARMWISGRPPVTNLYSSAVFVGWVAIILGLVLERLSKNGVGSFVSAVIGFLTLIIAHHLSFQGDVMEMMQAVLDSNFWLATHVVTINIGYGGTILMALLGHIYIFRGVFTRSFDKESRKSMVKMMFGMACFSMLFSFIGVMLGGIWADQSWGRFWGWDPKENGSLLIILCLAIILHARLAGVIQARGLAVLAVLANMVTAFSWFGVNMLGVGLHSYGFMDQAFVWLVAFMAVELMVIWVGLYPEDRWLCFRAKE